MADYWKSQPRHFCEFCKCWLADNKPSREFHERGKRHEENVKKKLDQMRKKGAQDAKVEKQKESFFHKMEQAALKKAKEDIQNDPSLAKQYGVTLKKSGCEPKPAEELPSVVVVKTGEPEKCPWKIVKSEDSHSYYWNQETNEVSWTLPDDVTLPEDATVSLDTETTTDEQEQSTEDEKKTKSIKFNIKKAPDETKTTELEAEKPEENQVAPTDISAIPLPGEVPSNTATQPQASNEEPAKTSTETVTSSELMNRKRPADRAYSRWQTVQPVKEPEPVDYQLPSTTTKNVKETVAAVVTNEPKMKFREKKVDILSQGLAEFKKRKKIERSIRSNNDS